MKRNIDEMIIDHLTVQLIGDKSFTAHPHCRVRTAWIRAKKIYKYMSDEEKARLLKLISEA
jgi:hypothetical protein